MNKEELLKPRFKVIADYPNSTNKIGDTIELPNNDWRYVDEVNCLCDYFECYPSIFKKLEWWEERDKKDMPEFICLKKTMFKIDKWELFNEELRPISYICLTSKYLFAEWFQNRKSSRPATKEEYEAYTKSKK